MLLSNPELSQSAEDSMDLFPLSSAFQFNFKFGITTISLSIKTAKAKAEGRDLPSAS